MELKTSTLKNLKRKELADLPDKLFVFARAKSFSKNSWKRLFSKEVQKHIETAMSRLPEALKPGEDYVVRGIEKQDADFVLVALPEEETTFSFLSAARDTLKKYLDWNVCQVGVVLPEVAHEALLADCLGAALGARIFLMPVFGKRREKQKKYRLKQAELFSSKNQKKSFHYGFHSAEGTNLVRSLGTLPPNYLNPEAYGREIRRLAKQAGLSVRFISNAQLRKMGAGAFTAVDQGDPDSKGGIFELSYKPSRAKNKKPATLVGKGICFDTGGYDVKTGENMITMKGDMQGSAVALSTLVVASKLKWPLHLKAYLAVTENHITPKAYKADEVITALNGMSIEVINTDAEGRMVLADTLTLASREKPELIVDFATLTGTAMVAIGTNYSAGFSNREAWNAAITEAGKVSGERVWPFPIDSDYGKALESTVADTLQCPKGRCPDHIMGAVFLRKFLESDVPWVHVDLSASDREGGLAHTDSKFTGFGVRWALSFLKKRYKL